MTKRVIAAVVVLSVIRVAVAANGIEILPNGKFEETREKLPASWGTMTFGTPAEFAVDSEVKHSGSRSARIKCPTTSRVYFRSDPIPVAPGEKITAGAWVKFKDVPVGKGTIILIGEFGRDEKSKGEVAKFNVADRKDKTEGDWQYIEGSVTIPANATLMRIRAGFSYSAGTCWWDDITVRAEQPIVARTTIEGTRLTPAKGAIPVAIINRDKKRGDVRVRVALDKKVATANVKLDGKLEQDVDVPLEFNQRGKATLETSLLEAKDKVVFTETRNVVIPPAVTLRPLIPTHWVREDGQPKIEAEIELALTPQQAKGAALQIGIEGGASETVKKLDPDGTNHITFSPKQLENGKYNFVAELRGGDGKTIDSKQSWEIIPRSRAKVTINADGYPVYDGKAIFPMGIFNGGRFEEQAKAGFTVTHAYNAFNYEPGERGRDEDAKRYLDGTEANGMKCMMLIPRGIVFSGDWDRFRRRIRMFRNHPALLAWDEEEGIARGDIDLAALKKMVQIIREEDPHHPIMVGDPVASIRAVVDRSKFFPADDMDMGMWWWYPFPAKSTSDDDLAGEQKFTGELIVPEFLAKRNTDKPIWLGIQSYKKGNPARYPTPEEYRCQPYIAFLEGAKGVMWYGGSVTNGMFLNVEEANWKYVQQLASELKEMTPILMSPAGAKPTHSPKEIPISVGTRKTKDGTVLIAVNRTFNPADITLASEEIHAGRAKVATENREVTTSKGELKDHFDPLAVHIYMLPGK